MLVLKFFGFNKKKGGYWYSFRNCFIVIFCMVALGVIVALFEKEINWLGIVELAVLTGIIYGLNFMAKRYIASLG